MALGKSIPNADEIKKEAGDNSAKKPSEPILKSLSKELRKALKVEDKLKDRTSVLYRLKDNKKIVIMGSMVTIICLYGLTTCSSDDASNKSFNLTGKETVKIETSGDSGLMNEEQAEYDYQQRINQGQQAGLDVSRANYKVIRKGRFDINEIRANPERFKIVSKAVGKDGSNVNIYIDIVTGETYDSEGNIVDYQHQPPAYVQQAPINYSNLGQAGAGGGFNDSSNQSSNSNTGGNNDANSSTAIPAQNGTVSMGLQNKLDTLNYNNQATFDTLTAISQAQQNSSQAFQMQVAQQQAQAQQQQAQYEQIANGQIQAVINKMYEPSSFSAMTHKLQNPAGFNATSFANSSYTSNGNGTGGSQVSETQSPYLPKSVLRQGSVMLVMVTTEVNTDKTSLVNGLILDGVYSGAKVQGTVVQKNKDIGVNFNLIFPKNPRLPVVTFNGIALDLVTNHDGVATSIKNHYVQNYLGILAKSAITGYGNAYASNAGTTTINRSDGTVITTTDNEVDTAEIRGQIYSALSQQLNKDTQSWGTRPVTYKIKQGTVLAVQLQANLETDPYKQAGMENTESMAMSNTQGRNATTYPNYQRPMPQNGFGGGFDGVIPRNDPELIYEAQRNASPAYRR